ncbi:MAG: MarR family transcriptional regulator [Dehalococcoidales bacterium]|nr:MarR family transcriptional regulator [Dehalococcoidales bacterium]
MDKEMLISEVIRLDRQVHRIIRRHSSDAWMGINLTMPQVKTLFFICNQPGATSSRLAEALGVTPPNVTGIVDRLVEQGLVTRRDNPEDRRVSVLQITPEGEAIISALRERKSSIMKEILEHLSAEELSRIVEALTGLSVAAQAFEANRRT